MNFMCEYTNIENDGRELIKNVNMKNKKRTAKKLLYAKMRAHTYNNSKYAYQFNENWN